MGEAVLPVLKMPPTRGATHVRKRAELWFCNRGSSSKVPLGGLEWPAMAGAGYALHRLRRRENSEDENGEDGSDALP